MLAKPSHCALCPKPGVGFVPPSGHGTNGISLVGMAPAKTEIEKGVPFVGRAGTVLSRILRQAGARDEFDIRNVVQCKGERDDLNFEGIDDAIEHCASLRDTYARTPKIKVALGAVPFYALTGRGEFRELRNKSGKVSHKWVGIPISKVRGYRFESTDGVPVIPTFHPSFLGYGNMHLIPLVVHDIQRALQERDLPPPQYPLAALTLFPTPEAFEAWLYEAFYSEFLVHDIETSYSRDYEEDDDEQDPSYEITRFSLARSDSAAVTAPYQEPFITILKEALGKYRGDRVGWNSDEFDDPREAKAGWPMLGRRVDARWLWKFLQPSLPQSLGCVSTFYTRVPEWKSIGSERGTDDELYSAMDAWATAECYKGVCKALRARKIRDANNTNNSMVVGTICGQKAGEMIYTNAYEMADRHITQMQALLNEIGARGIRVDMSRMDEFKTFMRQELDSIQLQLDSNCQLLPLRGFHPKQGYKRTPKDTTGMELALFGEAERWCKRKPFNPGSKDQVAAYMRSCGHKVPQNDDGGDTTAGNTLLMHWRKYNDDNYKLFVDYRKVVKLLSTYGEWPLTVRTETSTEYFLGEPIQYEKAVPYATTKFTNRPDTNRLSSVGPNIQNIPKKGKYAKAFRRVLVASPGCRLLRADLASAEAVIFAWLCGDALMMRIARLGMHNFAMARKLKLPVDLNEPDDTLRQRFAELKEKNKELYSVIKICVYGSLYLAGPRTLYEKNPEDFSGQREARQFQQVVFDTIPQIKIYQEGIVNRRYKYGAGRNWGWVGSRLYNPFGYSKLFCDMEGGDGPAACAFLPQSIIACIMKESMLDLWTDDLAQETMRWQIHDELVFDCPLPYLEKLRRTVTTTMNQPWSQLGELRIGVDIKDSEDMS